VNNKLENFLHFFGKMFWFYSRRCGKVVEDKIVAFKRPLRHLRLKPVVERADFENSLSTVINPVH
jgi:hypothetical protein